MLQHTDGALAASDGATAVLTRFRRATTLRLQHLQGDGDPQDILEEEDREAALDQAGAADEPLALTIEGFLSRHLEGMQASERPGRRARDRPSPDMVAVSGTEDSAGLSVGLPPGGPAAGALLVSLSGGVDSMVLAHILLCLRHRHRRPVCAVHIDYSNRAESAAEAAYLRSWCETRGVPLRVRTVLEVSRGVTPRDEYERESRRIRFDAYREAMAAHGASAVFFGHHMGDLQENVVSNVMKGASVLDVAGAGLRAGGEGGRTMALSAQKWTPRSIAHSFREQGASAEPCTPAPARRRAPDAAALPLP